MTLSFNLYPFSNTSNTTSSSYSSTESTTNACSSDGSKISLKYQLN